MSKPRETDAQDLVRAQVYATLCQELGHLYNNLRKIQARIHELEAMADAMDKLSQQKEGAQ
jgi:hypothetical protein